MTVVNTLTNRFKYGLMKKEVDLSTDSFKMALMTSAFAFNPDTHEQYANVSASEIAAGNGYTAGGKVLISGELTQNNTTDKGVMTWSNNKWIASGGDFPATGSAIIYDDTHANKIVAGCIDYGTDYTVVNGMTFQFTSIVLNLG